MGPRLAQLLLERLLNGDVDDSAQDGRHPALGVPFADPLTDDPANLAIGAVHAGEHIFPALAGRQRPGGAPLAVQIHFRVGELARHDQVRRRRNRHTEDPAHLGRPVELVR